MTDKVKDHSQDHHQHKQQQTQPKANLQHEQNKAVTEAAKPQDYVRKPGSQQQAPAQQHVVPQSPNFNEQQEIQSIEEGKAKELAAKPDQPPIPPEAERREG